MNITDYKRILDSMYSMGVYVIREDDHRILYFNQRVRDTSPQVREGTVCHELWAGTCHNCPLLYIGDKETSRTLNVDSPFGKIVDITANRITWEDDIPAFVITISPHEEPSLHSYGGILQGNLRTDEYEVVKMEFVGARKKLTEMKSLSRWLKSYGTDGSIYDSDAERYLKFVDFGYLSRELAGGKKNLTCTYRRMLERGYRWHLMEVVPDVAYSPENPAVRIYIRDVDKIYREGLELEESNLRNQRIINSLGEMNFGIYMVGLNSGTMRAVRVADDIDESYFEESRNWDEYYYRILREKCHPQCLDELWQNYCLKSLREAYSRGEKKIQTIGQRWFGKEYRYISVSAYFYEGHREDYVIVTLRDVDENTRAEMERSRNDRRMSAIIKSRYSVMNTVYLDTGMYERVCLDERDDEARSHTGDYTVYVQDAIDNLIFEKDIEKFRGLLSLESLRARAEGIFNFDEFVCQYRVKGESPAWVEEHVLFLRQEDGVVANILSRDITREKREEERMNLVAREKSYIINSLSSMFSFTCYIDLPHDHLRMVNQADDVRQVLGNAMNFSAAADRYASEHVHPDDREEFLHILSREYLSEKLSPENPFIAWEYRRVFLEGDKVNVSSWIRSTVVLAEASDGEVRTVLYVEQDVTESKEKEDRERAALREACEAAEHANVAKSEFLSRMSHDIRTPMNAIIGMTAIAGTHLDNQERVADCLNKINISSKHLLALINEVLDMSKIESGKIDLSEEEFNLSDLVQSLLTMLRPSVHAKNQELVLHIAHITHEDLVGDVLRLQQVFMNVAGNSIKYTPEKGRIEIEIEEKPSRVFGYGCYEFVFRDNGIGMSKEFLEKIFEPFARAEDSRISKIEGTGLGMTIAQNIVRMMNGTIRVESEVDKGSQFYVTVFLKLQDTKAADVKELVDLPVLVADDDQIACEATCNVLEDIGMKGEYVLSGAEAVARVAEAKRLGSQFFAVILDWKMPGMDGLETTRAIRKEIGPEVPIIILSSYDWTEVETEARMAGVDGFISKPLFKSRLVYLFKKIVGSDGRKELEASSRENFDFTGRRIMVVEDNELNREIAEEILGSTGVAVETAADGQEALNLFLEKGEGYYDMIFMDIQMPVMNGYEATSAIRRARRKDASVIPIIAMTANAFAEDVISSRRAGMDEHISKPLNVEQLLECMGRWMPGEE